MTAPSYPVWEDTGHMLFALRWNPYLHAVRLDVRTGDVERVPIAGAPGDEPVPAVFVEPLLRS